MISMLDIIYVVYNGEEDVGIKIYRVVVYWYLFVPNISKLDNFWRYHSSNDVQAAHHGMQMFNNRILKITHMMN